MGNQQHSSLVDALLNRAKRDGILYYPDWDTAVTAAGAEKMLALTRKPMGRITDSLVGVTTLTPPAVGLRDLTLRCIARKNHETFEAILSLVEKGQSYAAMSLLRPMCEELIFAKFLLNLSHADADEYLLEKSAFEILESLVVQADYFNTRRGENLSLAQHIQSPSTALKNIKRELEETKLRVKAICERLGWGHRLAPTVRFMAEKGGCIDIYQYFYHASSSAAHASLHNLYRMVWGDNSKGNYSVNSQHFEAYYRRVATVFGAILFDKLMKAITGRFPEMWIEGEEALYQENATLVTQYPPLIVTREELRFDA